MSVEALADHAKRRQEQAAAGRDPSLVAAIGELNGKHFVTRVAGQTVIASPEYDPCLSRDHLVFSRASDIRLLYQNRHYLVGFTKDNKEIWKDLGTAWLEHENRRGYPGGIRLIPKGDCPPDVYNMWRDFGVERRKGEWQRIKDHLINVICSGNQEYFDWLMYWYAYCAQNPEKPAEAAIVLRGKKGTGKGAAAQILLEMFRNHSLHLSDTRQLTGNFNAHLMDTLALFLDEALWAGDKASEGTLKRVITEKTLTIEPKHVNSFSVANRLKIIIASNNEWVVPVSADERRYVVLDVPETKKGDAKYFTQLFKAIEGDELPAFLDHLLNLDLSEFDHRNPPHTEALNKQKIIGLDSVHQFWMDCLVNGEIFGAGEAEWPKDIPVQVMHAAYVEHARAHGERHPVADNHMAAKLAEVMPNKILKKTRPYKAYEGLGDRPHRYALKDLAECRESFLTAMRIDAYEWPDED
jgi:hypothetical protein